MDSWGWVKRGTHAKSQDDSWSEVIGSEAEPVIRGAEWLRVNGAAVLNGSVQPGSSQIVSEPA